MKAGVRIGAVLLCAAFGACSLLGTGGTTEMQITDSAAFAKAHTYRLVVVNDDTVSAPVRAAIEEHIHSTLAAKGYRQVSGDGPADLRVQYRAALIGRVERDAEPAPKVSQLVSVGGADAATGYQPIAGSAGSATVGRLVVFVNDDHTGRIVWQGTSEGEAVGAGMARNSAGRAAARLLRDVPKAPH